MSPQSLIHLESCDLQQQFSSWCVTVQPPDLPPSKGYSVHTSSEQPQSGAFSLPKASVKYSDFGGAKQGGQGQWKFMDFP